MPLFTKDSLKIFYHEEGQGYPLILLSGLGGDHQSIWPPCFKVLSEQYRIIVPDNRNCGKTQFYEEIFTIEDMADDLKRLVDHLGISKFHLAGYSMGGFIAQQFALKYPEQVDRLILAATYSRMNNRLYLFMEGVKKAYEKTHSLQTVFDLVYPFLFNHGYYATVPREPVLLPEEELKEPYFGWLRQYDASRMFDSREWLKHIQNTTLVIGGRQDLLVPVEDLRFLQQEIPQSSLIMIEHAGHMIPFENLSAFTNAILQFLQTNSA